jgi:hypothetical protein
MKQLSLLEEARLRQPSTSDPEHVARLASEIVQELGLTPPIDLRVVASYRGIGRILYEDMDWSGSLTPEDGGFVMRLRRAEAWARQRFTGFHEIGHTFLPGYLDASVFRCEAPGTGVRAAAKRKSPEALADIAAAELLLPRDFVSADLREAEFGLETVRAIADRYDAGIHASANRVVELWPEPLLLLVLEESNKPRDVAGAEPRLRIQASWSQPFDLWPRAHKWKSATAESALARAWSGEIINGPASLSELGLTDPCELEIAARLFSYRAGSELRKRLFALYRPRSLPLHRRKDQDG